MASLSTISAAALLLGLSLSLALGACSDGSAADDPVDETAAAAAIFDGAALKHPQEMVTAAVLFAGPIETRAARLEQLALAAGPLASPDRADVLETEMRGASVDLESVEVGALASYRSGAIGGSGRWLMVSIGAEEAPRRVLVTVGRTEREHAAGVGSSALELTVFLEALRLVTLARVSAEAPSERMAFDFVLALDDDSGFEFLADLPRRPGILVGVLTLEEIAPVDPAARALVARSDRPGSVLAQCARSVLRDFSGVGVAWGEVGFGAGLEPLSAAILASRGQGILPLVELRGSYGAEGRDLAPPADLHQKMKLRRVPGGNPVIGSSEDRAALVGGPGYPLALAAARALAMSLLRCEAAYAGP